MLADFVEDAHHVIEGSLPVAVEKDLGLVRAGLRLECGQLSGKLAALKAEAGPDKAKVFLNSDRKATFDSVVGVLDEIRKQGITRIAIQTEKTEKTP